MTIEEYFAGDYNSEKSEIQYINKIIAEVLPLFKDFKPDTGGWGYLINENGPKNLAKKDYSASTSSMILYVLGKALGLVNNSSGQDLIYSSVFKMNDDLKTELKSLWVSQLGILEDKIFEKGAYSTTSTTFGNNDIFTLGWSIALLHSNESKKLLLIQEAAKIKIKRFLQSFKVESLFSLTDKTPLDHSFPALRALHVYYALYDQEAINDISFLPALKNYFLTKIHEQLSFSEIPNSNFDAAELVFSFEGVLRIDKALGQKSFDHNLTKRIFDVVENSQIKSPYWRPLKPFITTSQGLALLPLSVEIANSLLRCCKLLESYNEFYFSKYVNLFKRYTDWLKTRLVTIITKKDEFNGWHSEHINNPKIIHPWETAQVLHFLLKYNVMLQEHIGRTSLKLSKLEAKTIDKIKDKGEKLSYWNYIESEFDPIKPIAGNELNVYKYIGESFIKPRFDNDLKASTKYSMLLYGPPGTGKTTIAEQISACLKWPLITITPSDFISRGPDQVEAKAKIIFRTLEEQRNVVILLDEIDRLIMDRDSSLYNKQEDVFQFMTPSMLVKLRNLRKAENSIFIIATNYADKIDLAIKRVGRIDKQYLVLPQNLQARKIILTNLIKKTLGKKQIPNDVTEKNIDRLAKESVYYTYGELELLIEDALKNVESAPDTAIHNVTVSPPTINILSYNRRFEKLIQGDFEGNQQPWDEYLALNHLHAETGNFVIDEVSKNNEFITSLSSKINDVKLPEQWKASIKKYYGI